MEKINVTVGQVLGLQELKSMLGTNNIKVDMVPVMSDKAIECVVFDDEGIDTGERELKPVNEVFPIAINFYVNGEKFATSLVNKRNYEMLNKSGLKMLQTANFEVLNTEYKDFQRSILLLKITDITMGSEIL